MSEYQYFNLIKNVINEGEKRPTRNSNVISLFSPEKLTFDLHFFPLLTSKFINFNNIFNELLWFIKGQTDGKILKKQSTFIWKGNGTREFLDSVGLEKNKVDDLGPIYGFQWRHFGAEYETCDTNYSQKGFDQLRYIIKTIIFEPTSRRMVLSAWNPKDMHLMALPPCHVLCQFYVRKNFFLDCHLYQRSADIGLGVPYNIASYALLTSILAHMTGLYAGNFHYTIGDAHIYESHEMALFEQTKRPLHGPPRLHFNTPKKNYESLKFRPFIVDEILLEIECLTLDDISLVNYNHHEKINLKFY